MKNIKSKVREGYAKIAKTNGSCCGGSPCCSGANPAETISKNVGYKDEDMKNVPEGANLGLGCGNPIALASLKAGEAVLDLGSGAGFDAFLAAKKVGKDGRVIGVDMTPEMVEKARGNADKGGYKNVEFRLGEIESLPVADACVDVIISNCVINLSPDKQKVFQEAMRVLKNGGRLMVSDLVLRKELPGVIKKSVEAYVGCISGAVLKKEYLEYIKNAGFENIDVVGETSFPMDDMAHDITAKAIKDNIDLTPDDIKALEGSVVSIKVSAIKK
ncbi:MAG: arsenite methyltransferase [Candidatus Omnitrophota bacterium]